MKKFFLFILLLYGTFGIAQTLTKKYNNLNNRYEYYDSQGSMVGYQFYDNLDNSWKYYELPKQQQSMYVKPINTNLVNQALASKQSRYYINVSKIENAIQDIGERITNLDVDYDIQVAISNRFTNMLNSLNKKKLNYSSTSTTNQVINWLYQEINKAIEEETN